MITLGLDLSLTASGIVAIDEAGSVVEAKTYGYGLKRTSSNEEKIKRLLDISNCVQETLRGLVVKGDPVEVVIEGYAYSARGSQNDLAELQGVIKSQLFLQHGITPEVMPVSRARKLVFDTGRVSKGEVMSLLADMGVHFTDHNQADAYVVARARLNERQGGES